MRDAISAKYLLAAPPPRETIIPEGFMVTYLRPRVAHGAVKPRIAPRGDAPTMGHAARTTAQISRQGDRRALLNYAAKRT